MCSWPLKLMSALTMACMVANVQADGKAAFPGIGRAATPQEVAAWDIDVRADFKGLPAGAGSVAKGQEVWEAKCASCHGVFAESNDVFAPLVGGTTAQDVETGRVAGLKRNDYPGRTTLMKASNLSTLWDYINRAMPWNQPKSLSVQEVYAVTAYLLNLGRVVPDDFTLSDQNIREVQQRLPNRHGMTGAHALWPGLELGGVSQPDVVASACMKNCDASSVVSSSLPTLARNTHGNLAEQNRRVGPQRGADTSRPEASSLTQQVLTGQAQSPLPRAADVTLALAAEGKGEDKDAQALTQKNNCTACHEATSKLVGPSWVDVAKKHAGKADYLAEKIRSGGVGVWGAIPMPALALSDADAKRIASWLAAGASTATRK